MSVQDPNICILHNNLTSFSGYLKNNHTNQKSRRLAPLYAVGVPEQLSRLAYAYSVALCV